MNYIYDVVLNFNKELYEFFEWKDNDNLINVRKIPLIKVSDDDFVTIIYNKVRIKECILDNFKKNFSLYSEEINGNVICIITNGQRAAGIMFDELGEVIGKSSMLLDEEEEVLEESENLIETKIDYSINENMSNVNLRRIEKEKKKYIQDFLTEISDNKILKYIYFDYFEEETKSKNIKEILLLELKKQWNT